jgi:predicted enzyme related to lactoylglutathione lyase
MQKNTINWFEIPVVDFERAKNFYQQVFEYEMQEMEIANSRMGFLPYDQPGGGVGGAIVKGEGYDVTPDGVKIYFDCGEDLNPVLARIKQFGGKEIMGKTLISDEIGHFAMFIDTEGNHLCLFSTR